MNDFQRVTHHAMVGFGGMATQASKSSGTASIRLQLGIDANVLLASLSDGGALLLVGEVPDLERRLGQLEQRWILHRRAETGDQDATDWLQVFGAELFHQLLPGRIQSFFKQVQGCRLQIATDTKLAGVPWECVFDGHHHWQDFHVVSRAILGQRALSESGPAQRNRLITRVLLDCAGGEDPAWRNYTRELEQLLASQPNLVVGHARQLIPDASGWDIIHVADTPGHFLQRAQIDAVLKMRMQASRLVILDWYPAGGDGDSWQQEGEAIAIALARQTSLVCIKRVTAATCDASYAHALYSAISDSEDNPTSQTMLRFPPSVTVSQYGDNLVRLLSTEPQTGNLRSYRQVTALSYDLVGSTQLMQNIGMEQYSVSLRKYHSRFGEVIARWGGFFDQPQGDDGTMCYFGAHHTREDTVRCALYAAQELVSEAQNMKLRVRIGLATGQAAVTGDHVVGPGIHLAARIQALAPAGTILVSESTANLARSFFALDSFENDRELKGFSGSHRLFSLGAAKFADSAGFDAGFNSTLLHGRQTEMGQLYSQWALVARGQTRWLHVTGEAGIGKSRLVATFVNQVQYQGDVRTITCRCYAETAGRAFGPVIDMLERWFQIQSNDDAKTREFKLAKSVSDYGVSPEDHLAITYLMGLPAPKTHLPQSAETQEPRRKFLMRTLSAWLLNQARNHRLCFVLEDLQWADPSTLDYLHRLKKDSPGSTLMVILTERTEQSKLTSNPMMDSAIALERLPFTAVREMIASLTTGSNVSRRLAQSIEAKSDGIPLFVEMSTRMILEKQKAADPQDQEDESQDFAVPATLHDLLMQRLDNLGTTRSFAELCSVIGREFPRHLLLTLCEAGVANMPKELVQGHLTTLLRSGLLLASSVEQQVNVQYHFRHALVHEAAYRSMWESDRTRIHKEIAKAIETCLPETGIAHPEILAHHFEACGSMAEGAKWHWLAARKSKSNEAHTESLAHLASGKRLLQQLPETPQRVKSELDIELTMAGQLIATKGYGAPNVGRCYVAALTHANALNDKKSLLRAQLGLEAYYLVRADFGQAHAYLTQAQNTAKHFDDALTQAQCLFALANILHHQGHAQGMQDACQQCLTVCRSSNLQGNLVQSPEVMSLMYSAINVWEMGMVDLARMRGQEGVDIATELGQRLGLGQALGLHAMLLLLCGELERAESLSEQAISVCESGDHEMWAAHARIIYGCCVSELGDPQRGSELMELGYTQWTATGTVITRTFYLALRAPTCALLGRVDEALELINEACRIIADHGERYYEPEVLRVKAELLLLKKGKAGADHAAQADALLQKAKESASELGLPSLALRVATSMAQRCVTRGHKAHATNTLQSALAALTQGHDTRDQRVARQLLEQWIDEDTGLQEV